MIHKKQQPLTTSIDWDQLNAEWEVSPLSQKDFCLEKNVTYASFVSRRGEILEKKAHSKAQYLSGHCDAAQSSQGAPSIVVEVTDWRMPGYSAQY